MADLHIAGARQARAAGLTDRDHEPLYDLALVASSAATLSWRDPYGPSHACKGLAATSAGLLACTERELRWLGGDERRWSDPRLNDVHHAIEHDGAVWVVSTGADAVLEVRGSHVAVHALAGAVPAGDLRYRSLKPHRVHPNHAFVWRERVWVTCLHDGGARVVGGPGRLVVDPRGVHDGVVLDDRVWFTTVDGRLVGVDGRSRVEINLNDGRGPLGWCRGLAWHDGLWWVGFTRLRATRWRQRVAWLRGRWRGRVDVSDRPTRLVAVDPLRGSVVKELTLEERGIDAVFGLVAPSE